MARIIEKLCCRGSEALEVSPQRNVEPLAVGGSLLMGERKAAERLRQCLGLRALSHTAGAGNEKIGADIPGPDPDLHRRRDAAPGMGVRGDEHPHRAAPWQIRLSRLRGRRTVKS